MNPTPAQSDPAAKVDAHPLQFAGSGGEYFRVWIVNVLLGLVTFGLYTPWARRRTARYFYDHTVLVDTPLEFTAPIRKMVFGFLAFVVLYLAFEIASRAGQDAAVSLMLLGAAVLAPWLWGGAMRFRLGSTRWRGLQLRFEARWTEIYLASWPVFAVAGVWIGLNFGIEPRPAVTGDRTPSLRDVHPLHWALLAAAVAASLAALVRLDFNYSRLLFLRSGIGGQTGRWKLSYGAFVRVWLTSAAIFAASSLVLLLVIGGCVLAPLGIGLDRSGAGPTSRWLLVALLLVIVPLALFVATAPAWAYREARLFALVWSGVGLGRIARFRSTLDPWRFVRLRTKNVVLTVLTLGLYRPFARVSEYRMKVESVTMYVRGDLDRLVGRLERLQGGLGDALADAVGLDVVS